MRLFCRVELQALTAAPSQVPQVSLTVIHVQAGAVLSIGGVVLDPRITQAIPPRDAITTEERDLP
jgi:hypothetical protein